ncbi:TIR domain-containing protein [Streptomyces sp. NPDC001068]|uniref:toll/interleukin-1 receptor domain-containing protein n=1 Tax=Streptomyces sp. NPDC001068 TaxID=3364544 RepID=UPI0036CE2DF7
MSCRRVGSGLDAWLGGAGTGVRAAGTGDVSAGARVFVSHAGSDLAWAEWVAWQLQDAGHEVELDAWHWGAGENFVRNMDRALAAGPMVALFSAAYFDPERWTAEEWTARLADREELIPLRIEDCVAPPMLRALIAPALFGVGEEKAREVLLAAVAGPAGSPRMSPGFPGAGGGGRLRSMGATGPRLPGTLPRVWNVPARNAGFVGRDELLVEVRSRLAGGRAVTVVALDGRGGVGKTQLAAEYAHQIERGITGRARPRYRHPLGSAAGSGDGFGHVIWRAGVVMTVSNSMGVSRHRDGGGAVPGCGFVVACAECSHPVRRRPRQSRAGVGRRRTGRGRWWVDTGPRTMLVGARRHHWSIGCR